MNRRIGCILISVLSAGCFFAVADDWAASDAQKWAVFDVKSKEVFIDAGNPQKIEKENITYVVVINMASSASINATLVGVLKNYGALGFSAAAGCDFYDVTKKIDKDLNPVNAKQLISVDLSANVNGDKFSAICLGTTQWSGKYKAESLTEKISMSFAGVGVSEKAYSTLSVRYNAKVSASMNSGGNAQSTLVAYIAKTAKVTEDWVLYVTLP